MPTRIRGLSRSRANRLAVAGVAGAAGWWAMAWRGTDTFRAAGPPAPTDGRASASGAVADEREEMGPGASDSSSGLITTERARVRGGTPGVPTVTVGQRLDRSMAQPGVRGVVRGLTGAQGAPAAPGVPYVRGGPQPAQDFPFTVLGFVGSGPPPYAIGSTIALRIPVISGVVATALATTPAVHFAVSDVYPPTIAPGQELYVFLRDQGQYLGGNAPGRIVASSPTDVFTVYGATVRGQGEWASFAESRADFERRFTLP